MKHPTLARSGVVAVLAVASVALVPSAAMAKGGNASKASKVSEATQDFNIRRATRTNNRQRGQIAKVTNSLSDTIEQLTNVDNTIKALTPIITKALTDLQAGLVAVGNGLTTVGAGLTSLGSAYQAVEYGVTLFRTGPGGAGPPLPFSVISPDIPDDANTATAAGTIPISVGGGAGQVPANTPIVPKSAIRSNESDGAATGPPAGYVGGLLIVTCGGGPLGGGSCDVDPTAGTAAAPPGTVVCVVGPPPSQPINVPGVGNQNFFLNTIQVKAGRTDQSKPDAGSVNPLAGASAGAGSVIGPLGDDANDGCRTGDAGNTLLFNIQTQFVDIPTSTTPGPTE
jgi:hypothetical protein